MKLETEIKKGKDVSSYLKRSWNKIMKKTFGSSPLENFSKDIFFKVKDEKKLVVMGALTPVRIKYLGKTYNILGITEIVALKRKKGYGKILMQEILKYVEKTGKTAVGFTGDRTSPFYKKCGLKIKPGMVKKFVYTPKNKAEEKEVKYALKNDSDVIYIERKDKFITKVASSKLNVQLPCMYW